MPHDKTGWNAVYTNQPYRKRETHKEMFRLHGRFRQDNVKRILDLGCGDGRHLVHFARLGYEVSGIDSADVGVAKSKEWLGREGLSAEVVCGDMLELPWPDARFDAVLAVQVINHNKMAEIVRTINEVRRVLRAGGTFFATVPIFPLTEGWDNVELDEIEHHTFVSKTGHEAGVPHHCFTTEELRTTLVGFRVEDVWKDDTGHYAALAAKVNDGGT